MNKNLIYKGVTCAVLGATIVGALAFAPINEEPEAAHVSKKICSHTNVSVQINTLSDKTVRRILTINTNNTKAKYHHGHTQTYITRTKHFKLIDSYTTTNKQSTFTSDTTMISNYLTHTVNQFTTNKKNSTAKPVCTHKYGKSKVTCGACGIKQETPTSTVKVKCPCCSKTVSVNLKTGKIS